MSQQAPLEVTSEVGEILEVSFDVAFTGGEYMCLDTTASGAIKRVNASLVYTMYEYIIIKIVFLFLTLVGLLILPKPPLILLPL